jgi:hypothetical protein
MGALDHCLGAKRDDEELVSTSNRGSAFPTIVALILPAKVVDQDDGCCLPNV